MLCAIKYNMTPTHGVYIDRNLVPKRLVIFKSFSVWRKTPDSLAVQFSFSDESLLKKVDKEKPP